MKTWIRRITSPTARTIGTLWTIVVLVSGFVLHTSIREADCDRQFRTALVARAAAGDEADRFADAQQDAIAAWVHDFSNPPPGASQYGPERMTWLTDVSARAMKRFDDLGAERARYVQDKRDHPFPEPTCGS